MVELNGCDPIKIKVTGPYTFSIGNTTKFSEYLRGGTVTQVKMPTTVSYKSFEEASAAPEIVYSDFGKFLEADALHYAFMALDEFIAAKGRRPRPWNNEDAVELANFAKAKSDFKEDFFIQFAKVTSFEFNVVVRDYNVC